MSKGAFLGAAKFDATFFLFLWRNAMHHFLSRLSCASNGRILLSPSQPVDLRLTAQCNLSCRQCSSWHPKSNSELTARDWQMVIQQLKGWMPQLYLRFYGGEPLMRSDFFDILQFCQKLRIPSCMTSNGFLIDKDVARRLRDGGMIQVTLSLDGFSPQVHDWLRGKSGVFEGVLRAVFHLRGHLAVRLNTTLMQQNLRQIPEILKFSADSRIPISFVTLYNPIVPRDVKFGKDWHDAEELWPSDAAAVGEAWQTIRAFKKRHPFLVLNSDRHIDFLIRYCTDPFFKNNAKRCDIQFSRLWIYENGDAYACFFQEPIGNVLKAHLRDIWYSRQARIVRNRMRSCQINCHCMRGCFRESFVEKANKFIYDFFTSKSKLLRQKSWQATSPTTGSSVVCNPS